MTTNELTPRQAAILELLDLPDPPELRERNYYYIFEPDPTTAWVRKLRLAADFLASKAHDRARTEDQ